MKNFKTSLFLFTILILGSSNLAADIAVEKEIKKEIEQWGMIDENIYRGAQPTKHGLELLKKMGVKTIINLRHEPEEIAQEKEWVEALGMKFIKLPWRIQVQPKEAVMKDYLEALKKSEDGPFFVHCRRGAERTGVAEALYLYYNKGFSFDQAYEKSINGYHTLFYWRPFIKKRFKGFVDAIGPQEKVIQG